MCAHGMPGCRRGGTWWGRKTTSGWQHWTVEDASVPTRVANWVSASATSPTRPQPWFFEPRRAPPVDQPSSHVATGLRLTLWTSRGSIRCASADLPSPAVGCRACCCRRAAAKPPLQPKLPCTGGSESVWSRFSRRTERFPWTTWPHWSQCGVALLPSLTHHTTSSPLGCSASGSTT